MVESIGSNEPIDGRIAYVEFPRAETRHVDGAEFWYFIGFVGYRRPFYLPSPKVIWSNMTSVSTPASPESRAKPIRR